MSDLYLNSLKKLVSYCESEDFKGYDPYDTLNSSINFKLFGKWGPPVATQIQKRNPFNIRPLLGIKKGYNPKGMGLFLKAYALLYQKTGEKKYLEKADWLFNWLIKNYSPGYSGLCWGYNFDWASPGSHLAAYTPSVVVTSFVVDGIYAYYKATNNEQARNAIISSADFIRKDIPVTEFPEGISFAYTKFSTGACYNASLLTAEVLAKASILAGKTADNVYIERAISFVLSKQKQDGSWFYSYNPETGKERKQIDFHQGFVLVSLYDLLNLTGILKEKIETALKRGLTFYKEQQFHAEGRALGRLPRQWPVDIHNQSQGIITFALLKEYETGYFNFTKQIATWTIDNMQDKAGYFYYSKYPFFTNKTPYMRWTQAWMLLALTELITNE